MVNLARCALLLGVAGCRFAIDPLADASPPSIASHSYSLLRIDRAEISEVLTDFPLLVVLDNDHLDRSAMRADASDLRFSLDGDGAVLAHEIEDVGTAGGAPLLAWVRLPSLVGRATVLRVSYGQGDDDLPAATGSVWSASYRAVFHLAEAIGVPRDATGNVPASAIRAVGVQPVRDAAPGRIGDGRRFASAQQNAVEIATPVATDAAVEITISGWIYETALPPAFEYHAAISRQHEDVGFNSFWLGDSGGTYTGELVRDGHEVFVRADAAGQGAVAGAWVHLALAVGDAGAVLYINGLPAATDAAAGAPPADEGKPIVLGADVNHPDGLPNDDLMDGMLDEVRIEAVARSAQWLRVQYLAMTDQLISYGDVQRGAPP